MSDITQPNAKILFRVVEDSGSVNVETLWAFDMGNDRYRIDNCPFYAYGVSLGDIVYAPFDRDEQFPTFQRVVTKSGNRTVRIILDPPVQPGNDSDRILKKLATFGCGYEGASKSYIVVNVPPKVDLDEIRDYLIECNARWEHADPTYKQLHPNEAD